MPAQEIATYIRFLSITTVQIHTYSIQVMIPGRGQTRHKKSNARQQQRPKPKPNQAKPKHAGDTDAPNTRGLCSLPRECPNLGAAEVAGGEMPIGVLGDSKLRHGRPRGDRGLLPVRAVTFATSVNYYLELRLGPERSSVLGNFLKYVLS